MFGLTGEALANRVRDAFKAAGLGDNFSGHSGRIGMARRMVAAGALTAVVQHLGPMAPRRYGCPLHPGRGGRGSSQTAELTERPLPKTSSKIQGACVKIGVSKELAPPIHSNHVGVTQTQPVSDSYRQTAVPAQPI